MLCHYTSMIEGRASWKHHMLCVAVSVLMWWCDTVCDFSALNHKDIMIVMMTMTITTTIMVIIVLVATTMMITVMVIMIVIMMRTLRGVLLDFFTVHWLSAAYTLMKWHLTQWIHNLWWHSSAMNLDRVETTFVISLLSEIIYWWPSVVFCWHCGNVVM